MKLLKYISMILCGCIVSGYFFPFGFTFLPESLNTKQIIGVLGIAAFVYDCLRKREFSMSRPVIVGACWATVFSIWCFFCMVANNTPDTSYATYFVSFSVWLGGAYGTIAILRALHGKVSFKLLVDYLIAICIAQCVLALLIDSYPALKMLVDTYIEQGQKFMDEVDRLYGIGASLDPAGCRFSVVLVLLAHLLATNQDMNWKILFIYILCYLFILVVGNMLSRTTSVGGCLGLVYLLLSVGFTHGRTITKRQLIFHGVFWGTITIAVTTCIILYNTTPDFKSNIRFAFEAFFNYFETGSFRTDSVDKLNAVMWIWPDSIRSWLIGNGWFGYYVYATDIGYCRFTLYCGLIGLVIFSGFFIYNGISIMKLYPNAIMLGLLLIALTFIIWVKVATDIFFIYALLYCIDYKENQPQLIQDENPL